MSDIIPKPDYPDENVDVAPLFWKLSRKRSLLEPLHFGKLAIGSKNPDGEWFAVAGGGENKRAAGAVPSPNVLEAIVGDDCLRLLAIDCIDRDDTGN